MTRGPNRSRPGTVIRRISSRRILRLGNRGTNRQYTADSAAAEKASPHRHLGTFRESVLEQVDAVDTVGQVCAINLACRRRGAGGFGLSGRVVPRGQVVEQHDRVESENHRRDGTALLYQAGE